MPTFKLHPFDFNAQKVALAISTKWSGIYLAMSTSLKLESGSIRGEKASDLTALWSAGLQDQDLATAWASQQQLVV